MAAVTIYSDFGAQKIKSDTVSTVSPFISHEVMGPDAMILVKFKIYNVMIWYMYNCEMIAIRRLVNTLFMSYNYHILVVKTFKLYFLSNFKYMIELLTIVTVLYIRSPEY